MSEIDEVFEKLKSEPRLLIEVDLKPRQGERFQPTGFPDLGAAEYVAPDGRTMLLVESTQSMANRMEAVCWDNAREDLVEPLQGLPYIKVLLDDHGAFTTSILEAHRINSEYITGRSSGRVEGHEKTFKEVLIEEIGVQDDKPVQFKRLYQTLLRYDPNSLIHGAFLEEIDGRLRIPRMLSGSIEASGVHPVQSGGVKFSHVQPKLRGGEGNVPYPRIEYTAEKITAYFNLDLAGIRGFYLDEVAEKLLIVLSLYKIQKFLREGLRLRTACDLAPVGEMRINISELKIPSLEELESKLLELIKECASRGLFAQPPVTVITR